MEKEFKQITGTLNRLDLLYSAHLASLENEELPDLNHQNKVRDLEIKRLTAEISSFMAMAEANAMQKATEPMVKCVHERIADILEQNNVLEFKVKAFKKSLQKNMARVSKGRNAIGAYRSPNAPGAASRVLSISN